jgi:hypothetical protein
VLLDQARLGAAGGVVVDHGMDFAFIGVREDHGGRGLEAVDVIDGGQLEQAQGPSREEPSFLITLRACERGQGSLFRRCWRETRRLGSRARWFELCLSPTRR